MTAIFIFKIGQSNFLSPCSHISIHNPPQHHIAHACSCAMLHFHSPRQSSYRTYLTHSHINATIILANVEIKVFVVDPQVTSLGQLAFESKKDLSWKGRRSLSLRIFLTRHPNLRTHPKDPLMHHEIRLSPALEWRFENVDHHVWLFVIPWKISKLILRSF